MENKVLIKLFLPEIDSSFDVFIPVNEIVWKVKKMLVKLVNDVININLDLKSDYMMINRTNNRIYNNNEVVIDTDIRNASEIILLSR